jgi:hypothetical protein
MADDEFTLRKDMEAAAQVQAALDGPIAAAFDTLKATYHEAWEASGPRDDEGRRNLWQAVQIVGKVRSHLETIVANGKLAERQIAEITARPKRFGIV